MDKILIIVNPSSGDKKGSEFADSIQDIFSQKDYQIKLYETQGKDNFKKLIIDSMKDGFNTAVLLGGDGTVSEFVDQISDLDKRPEILLLPLGTTNNFARALDSELNYEKLLDKIEKEEFYEKQVDVGQINDHYFISTVSIGSIPEVAWKTSDGLKEELGSLAYMFEGIKVLGEEYNNFDVEIKTEKEDLNEKNVFLIVIGLSNSVFGVPIFFEDAKLDDGKLHIYVLKEGSIVDVAGSIAKRVLNEDQVDFENDLSFTTSFKNAELSANTDLVSSVDGEKGPGFPIKLGVLHNHLTFLFLKKEHLLNR